MLRPRIPTPYSLWPLVACCLLGCAASEPEPGATESAVPQSSTSQTRGNPSNSCAPAVSSADTNCIDEALAKAERDVPATGETPATDSSDTSGPRKPLQQTPDNQTAKPDGPRVYAKTRYVWIFPKPSSEGQWIGFLWTGGSVKLKDTNPVAGPGCRSWYAIEPRGYVCAEGDRATLDPQDEAYQAILPYAPDKTTPWPHRYGETIGTPLYRGIPSLRRMRQVEYDVVNHLKRVEDARSGEPQLALAGVDLRPSTDEPVIFPELPKTIHEPRSTLRPRSTLAYTAEAQAGDRAWLLSADMRWVPKDRVVPYPHVSFEGLHLGKDAELPLAFFRSADRPKYLRDEDGSFEQTQRSWKRLSYVELTGERADNEDEVFLRTKDEDFWLKKSEAVVPTPMSRTPWGFEVGGDEPAGGAKRGHGTWIEVSVWGGWLIAYEGSKPVFTTLISPGQGGTPRPGKDPLETAATPTGRFPISGKFVTATMVAPNDLVHADVPWTQNFSGPYALHSAYWHNDWGERKSGGCINVSPIDGKWLFEFTEPRFPPGWHGVRWLPSLEPATILIVHD